MRWPFRKRTSYQKAVRETGEGLYDASLLLTGQVKEGWADVQNHLNLTNEQQWLVMREVLWYLLSQCDRAIRFDLQVENADEVMSGITTWSLNKFISAFDFSNSPQTAREAQQRQLSTWQAKAAADYRQTPQPISVKQQGEILRTGGLVPNGPLDRLNRRIETALGLSLTDRESENIGGTQPSRSIYDRITAEGISLEDVVVTTVGQIGNNMGEIVKASHLDEVLLR